MQLNKQTLNMVGGGIIIAAAFVVMFPGFLTYFGGLMRVAIFVTVTLLLAFSVSFILKKVRAAKDAVTSSQNTSAADTRSDT